MAGLSHAWLAKASVWASRLPPGIRDARRGDGQSQSQGNTGSYFTQDFEDGEGFCWTEAHSVHACAGLRFPLRQTTRSVFWGSVSDENAFGATRRRPRRRHVEATRAGYIRKFRQLRCLVFDLLLWPRARSARGR